MLKENTKFAKIAIIGQTNSGKSTLVNNFLGEKVSIVSKKVQTTKTRVLGILNEPNIQIVFIDTPGIFNPKRNLDSILIKQAYQDIEHANKILLLVDCTNINLDYTKKIIKNLENLKIDLVINKIDLIKNKEDLLKIATMLSALHSFDKIYMISAKKQDGMEKLKQDIIDNTPTGEFEFPDYAVSDVSFKEFSKEITREQILNLVHKEIPYNIVIEIEDYKEEEKQITVKQIIYVINESHKKILIGKNAEKIKHIGQSARKELEKIAEKKVNLFLYVKIDEKCLQKSYIK